MRDWTGRTAASERRKQMGGEEGRGKGNGWHAVLPPSINITKEAMHHANAERKRRQCHKQSLVTLRASHPSSLSSLHLMLPCLASTSILSSPQESTQRVHANLLDVSPLLLLSNGISLADDQKKRLRLCRLAILLEREGKNLLATINTQEYRSCVVTDPHRNNLSRS